MIAANRSSDTRREKSPPCSSVRLLAIERPSPLPSVFRLRSPRTKRPMRSSAETCSASFAVFATVMMTCSASVFTVTEKLLFSFAYLHRLPKRFSSTRQNCRPSASIITGSAGRFHTGVSPFSSKRSSNSPYAWSSIACTCRMVICSSTLPELILLTSTRSSVSCFRRCDFWSSTSI